MRDTLRLLLVSLWGHKGREEGESLQYQTDGDTCPQALEFPVQAEREAEGYGKRYDIV